MNAMPAPFDSYVDTITNGACFLTAMLAPEKRNAILAAAAVTPDPVLLRPIVIDILFNRQTPVVPAPVVVPTPAAPAPAPVVTAVPSPDESVHASTVTEQPPTKTRRTANGAVRATPAVDQEESTRATSPVRRTPVAPVAAAAVAPENEPTPAESKSDDEPLDLVQIANDRDYEVYEMTGFNDSITLNGIWSSSAEKNSTAPRILLYMKTDGKSLAVGDILKEGAPPVNKITKSIATKQAIVVPKDVCGFIHRSIHILAGIDQTQTAKVLYNVATHATIVAIKGAKMVHRYNTDAHDDAWHLLMPHQTLDDPKEEEKKKGMNEEQLDEFEKKKKARGWRGFAPHLFLSKDVPASRAARFAAALPGTYVHLPGWDAAMNLAFSNLQKKSVLCTPTDLDEFASSTGQKAVNMGPILDSLKKHLTGADAKKTDTLTFYVWMSGKDILVETQVEQLNSRPNRKEEVCVIQLAIPRQALVLMYSVYQSIAKSKKAGVRPYPMRIALVEAGDVPLFAVEWFNNNVKPNMFLVSGKKIETFLHPRRTTPVAEKPKLVESDVESDNDIENQSVSENEGSDADSTGYTL